jgi:hypothetical protein
LRDDLEYLLELLADPEANIEALEAMHDQALYEELRTTVPAEVPPASGAAEDLTDTAENAPVLLMLQLDFAESVEEIRQARQGGAAGGGTHCRRRTCGAACTRKRKRRRRHVSLSQRECEAGTRRRPRRRR